MSTNFEFIDIKRIEPETKPISARKIDFGEICKIYKTAALKTLDTHSN